MVYHTLLSVISVDLIVVKTHRGPIPLSLKVFGEPNLQVLSSPFVGHDLRTIDCQQQNRDLSGYPQIKRVDLLGAARSRHGDAVSTVSRFGLILIVGSDGTTSLWLEPVPQT